MRAGFGSVTRRRAVDAVENSVDSAAFAGLAADEAPVGATQRMAVRAVFGRSRLSPTPGRPQQRPADIHSIDHTFD